MEKYFRLHPYVVLADGKDKCAIYNLLNGKVYCISKDEYNLLNRCEKNTPLNEIENVNYTFLNELKNNGLGLDYAGSIYVDKHFYGKHQAIAELVNTVELNALFMELTNKCNLGCKFCKYDDILYRKTGCKKWPTIKNDLNIQEWKNIILQAKYLHCHNFVIVGGEPLLEFKKLKEVVLYIKEILGLNANIIVYTNGVLLENKEILNFIEKQRIKVNIQILSDNNQTYHRITGREKLFDKISNVIEQVTKRNIPHQLSLLVSKFNEDEVEGIAEKFKQNISVDYIYPIKNDFFSRKYLEQMYDRTKSFKKPSLPFYDKISKYHNCYKGIIAISCDGSMYPCIMSRQLYLGNIHDSTIKDIISSPKYIEYSRLHKGTINDCKNCHKRYGCFDCRALEMSATNSMYGMEFCNLIRGNPNE